jgi:hypothetical protein
MTIREGPPGLQGDVTAREVRKLKNAVERLEAVIAQYYGKE